METSISDSYDEEGHEDFSGMFFEVSNTLIYPAGELILMGDYLSIERGHSSQYAVTEIGQIQLDRGTLVAVIRQNELSAVWEATPTSNDKTVRNRHGSYLIRLFSLEICVPYIVHEFTRPSFPHSLNSLLKLTSSKNHFVIVIYDRHLSTREIR